MIDEGTLRKDYPFIAWDQPAEITISGFGEFFACRYCIALYGVKGQDIVDGTSNIAWGFRDDALEHIERVHHD